MRRGESLSDGPGNSELGNSPQIPFMASNFKKMHSKPFELEQEVTDSQLELLGLESQGSKKHPVSVRDISCGPVPVLARHPHTSASLSVRNMSVFNHQKFGSGGRPGIEDGLNDADETRPVLASERSLSSLEANFSHLKQVAREQSRRRVSHHRDSLGREKQKSIFSVGELPSSRDVDLQLPSKHSTRRTVAPTDSIMTEPLFPERPENSSLRPSEDSSALYPDMPVQPDGKNRNESKVNDNSATLTRVFLAGLFSEPLKDHPRRMANNKTLFSTQIAYRPVNYSMEIRNVHQSIKEAGQDETILKIAPLTIFNFSQTMLYGPELIHIMCHGRTDGREFYLEFENSRAVKILVSKSSIDSILSLRSLPNTALVFINACHSGHIADVFLSHGARNVISVYPACPINDTVASSFARHFYLRLFRGETIRSAFEGAKVDVRHSQTALEAMKVNYEFCNHLHTPQCLYHSQTKSGMTKNLKAALEHLKGCVCPERVSNRHTKVCLQPIEDLLHHLGFKLAAVVDSPDTLTVCCCRTDVPHREEEKYVLHSQHDLAAEVTIESMVVEKAPIQRDLPFYQYAYIRLRFMERWFCPRRFNDGMFKLYHFYALNHSKLAVLYGPPDCGLNTFAQQFSHYCFHREKFSFVEYGDFRDKDDPMDVVQQIKVQLEALRLKMKEDQGVNLPKNPKLLYICHEFDKIFQSSSKNLTEMLDYGFKQFSVSYLITCRKQPPKDKTFGAKVLRISQLDAGDAIQIFLMQMNGKKIAQRWDLDLFLNTPEIQVAFDTLPKYPKAIVRFGRMVEEREADFADWPAIARELRPAFDLE